MPAITPGEALGLTTYDSARVEAYFKETNDLLRGMKPGDHRDVPPPEMFTDAMYDLMVNDYRGKGWNVQWMHDTFGHANFMRFHIERQFHRDGAVSKPVTEEDME